MSENFSYCRVVAKIKVYNIYLQAILINIPEVVGSIRKQA